MTWAGLIDRARRSPSPPPAAEYSSSDDADCSRRPILSGLVLIGADPARGDLDRRTLPRTLLPGGLARPCSIGLASTRARPPAIGSRYLGGRHRSTPCRRTAARGSSRRPGLLAAGSFSGARGRG